MPAPPDFEKTLNIYLKLREHADTSGMVRRSLRNLAKDLGYRSWSAIRLHILHLESVGLISRDMSRPHTDRPIKFEVPDLFDIGELTRIISEGERASWRKRAAEARGGRDMKTMDQTVTCDGRLPAAPLNFLFAILDDDTLEVTVKVALESREELPVSVRDALNQAVDSHVRVDGFRNSRSAPAPIILRQVCELVRSSHQMATPVLQAWYEVEKDLCQAVREKLIALDIPIREPDTLSQPLQVEYDRSTFAEAMLACVETLPDYNPNAVALMLQLLSGKAMADYPEEQEYDIEDEGGEEESWIEDFSESQYDSEVGRVLSSTLIALRNLPFSAPEWEKVIPEFDRLLSSITETKQAHRAMASSLDTLMKEMQTDYSHLLAFFQCDLTGWSVANLVPAYSYIELHCQAEKLRKMLVEYAPIHDRASLVTDEMRRAARRAKLIPQVMDAITHLQKMFSKADGSDDTPHTADDDSEPVCRGCSSSLNIVGGAPNLDAAHTSEKPPAPQSMQSGELESSHPEASTVRDQESPLASYGCTEVPACDIDFISDLRSYAQDLEEDYEELKYENAGLKAEVKAMERQLFESRRQEEGWRLALACQENPSEEEIPELEDVNAAVKLAMNRFPGQLLFQLNADSDVAGSDYTRPDRVWRALRWLATDYFTSHLGQNPIGNMDEACRRASDMWYKTSQHVTTMAQFPDAYSTRVDGRPIWLREHIGRGTSFDPRHTIRIGFDWDRRLQKVVIGYIGQHQRTAAT